MTKKWLLSIMAVWSMAIAVACDNDESDTGDSEPEDTGGTDDELEYGELSEALFSIDRLMEVSIDIDEAEWDSLRFDAPGLEHFQSACPAGPRPRSFEWHAATVSVDGESFGEVSIRKKGLMGSMTSFRPSLKLKFDREHRPSGIRRMTLNNEDDDLTASRECLSYDLFRAAGIAAPRCGLARVTVNGQDLGVYTHIEELKKPMLKLNFGGDADKTDLYEITMADFVKDRIVMFEPKGEDDNDDDSAGPADLSALKAIADALEADDDELFAELGKYVDLDLFFKYWAMEVITAHGDGYTGNQNNSFVYRNPETGLFVFIPWGTDGTFYPPADFFSDFTGNDSPIPWSVYANGALSRRLLDHPEGRERYEETLRRLLSEVWDEAALIAKINRIQETIRPHLQESLEAANEEEVDYLVEFIQDHRKRILDELDQGLPEWDRPMPPLLCAVIEHTVIGVLDTNMDTLESSILDTGDGHATDSLGTESLELPIVRGTIGEYTDHFDYDWVFLQLAVGLVDETHALVFLIDIPKELFEEGRTIKLDYGEAMADVATVDIVTGEFRGLGFVMTGELTVETLEPTPGGAVSIAFNAPVGVIQI
jgi:spore coat protein CotH